MRFWRSIFFYITLAISTVILGIAAIVVVMLTRRSDWAHLIGRAWARVNLWAAGTTVSVNGLDNIRFDGSCIYAANHQSGFDILALLGKLPVQFRWLAKAELFRFPILGQAMKASGYIPIDRDNRHKAFESINLAARRVREGNSIFIFPEGTRSLDGILQDFKKGGFILAIQSQHPMVPISITGSHRILPKRGEWRISPGTIRITIGQPIPTAGITIRNRDVLIQQVREAIRQNLPESEGGLIFDAPDPSMKTCPCEGKM
jgi:1-acyl-sn-glycerol-3-phosphate acyltransferase